jgi:hypothetical protein
MPDKRGAGGLSFTRRASRGPGGPFFSDMALVKVIVPSYGYAHHLRDCVASVVSQAGVETRVLIVDDCSPDDTAAVAAEIVAGDARVEYLKNPENLGLIGTANRGLEWAADGDYTVLLSADDLLAPGALGRATRLMEARPEVSFVYGHAPDFATNDALPDAGSHWGNKVWRGSDWIRRRCRVGINCIASPEVVVRTTAQNAAGPYSTANKNTSDLHMWLRLAGLGDVGYVIGAAQAYYRIHEGSMFRTMLSDWGGLTMDLRERLGAFGQYLAGSGLPAAEIAELEALVARAIGGEALWEAGRHYDRGEFEAANALSAFVGEEFPDRDDLPGRADLRLRRALGPDASGRFPPFLAARAMHRARGHLRWVRWRYAGV